MRGSRLALTVLACAALAACENGPAQTFVPPPPGAGNIWNNGWDPGATPPAGTSDTATAGFTDEGDVTNLFYPCDGATLETTWSNMVIQPIVANGAGGLYMAGVDANNNVTWNGLTIDQAIAQLCQATNLNGYFGAGTFDDGWGNGAILVADYNSTNRFIDILTINSGYIGALIVTDPQASTSDICGTLPTPCVATWTIAEAQQISLQVAAEGTTLVPCGTTTTTVCQAGISNPNPLMGMNLPSSTPSTKVFFQWNGNTTENDYWASIYNGMVNNFQKDLIPSGFPGAGQGSCFDTGQCLTNAFGNTPYFYAPGFGAGFIFGPSNASQPVPSIPQQFQMYFAKFMPYSFLDPTLALNATGPTAAGLVGNMTVSSPAMCSLQFGLTYSNFLSDCVNVDGDTADNMIEQKKLLEGLSHDDQSFDFDLQGVDIDFYATDLAPTAIVQDLVPPDPQDYDGYFNVDQSTYGQVVNDMSPQGWNDLHGTGAVYREYGRQTMSALRQGAGYPEGVTCQTASDCYGSLPSGQASGYACSGSPGSPGTCGITPAMVAQCLYTPGSPPADPVAWQAALPGWCTGFEGMITPAVPTGPDDLTDLGDPSFGGTIGYNPANLPPFNITGLKPGTPNAYFCFDPGGVTNAEILITDEYPQIAPALNLQGAPNIAFQGFTNCFPPPGNFGDNAVEAPAIFSASLARATAVMGHGNVANLPLGAQDNRFFFKQFGVALLKYMMASDQSGVDLTQGTCVTNSDCSSAPSGYKCVSGVCTVPVEYNDLFFDSLGDGQYENMEYVDRRFANTTTPPVPQDFVLTCDVKDGILNSYDFYHELYRGENLIYGAMRTNSSDALGAESNALLSNIFGSHVLQSALQASAATGLPYWQDTTNPNTGALVHTAYQCATQNLTAAANPSDPAPCRNPPPLNPDGSLILNPDGVPLLAPYQPLLSNTLQPSAFAIGQSQLQVVQTYPGEMEAMVSVPIYNNPFDPTSGSPADGTTVGPYTVMNGRIQGLIPWLFQQPSVGVSIPVNAVSDMLLESSNVDFTGITLTADVAYNLYTTGTCSNSATTSCTVDAECGTGGTCNTSQYMNIEEDASGDFLGDVFLCQDPLTGDILSARMYDTVDRIMNWIGAHPSTYNSCGLIVEFSPYNNYVTFITSMVNGVGIDTTQGGGGGRVIGAVIFNPSL